jgi:hypothetical protein
MRKLLIKAVALIITACLAGCPTPTSGGEPSGQSPAQEAAEAFRQAHAGVLAKNTDDITEGDDAAVDAALSAYNVLGAGAKALLKPETALLDDLKVEIANPGVHAAAAAFKEAHAGVLAKNADTVTAGEEDAVDAALSAYNALGAAAKALLKAEKALLDGLKVVTADPAAQAAAAAAFREAHAGVLAKKAANVTAGDKDAVDAALNAYNALSAAVKALLKAEKALLDGLKLETVYTGAHAAAAAFRNAYAGVLAKTADTVTVSDDPALDAALNTYSALNAGARALLRAEKALLDRLKLALLGVSSITITGWENEDEGLLDNLPDELYITTNQGSGGERYLTLSAAGGLTNIQWYLNGNPIDAPRGTGPSVTIDAAQYLNGFFTLGLIAKKDGVPYSWNITFTVDNN